MAIPSGAGTEVLRRNSIFNQSTTLTNIDWAQSAQTAAGNSSGTIAVPAEAIITVFDIVWCNRHADTRTLDLIIANSSGSVVDIQILDTQSIATLQTFVFSDKLVLREGDKLQFDMSSDNVDIYLNYIYQAF
jgi:hypothetical protein